jgi:hypothetical protein
MPINFRTDKTPGAARGWQIVCPFLPPGADRGHLLA